MKDYRQSELRMYCIAVILMYFLLGGRVEGMDSFVQGENMIEIVMELLNCAIISSTIYIFIYILDSVYEGDFKRKLVYVGQPEPGQKIFIDIFEKSDDPRFSKEEVEHYYGYVLEKLGRISLERDKRSYQNQQWYHIYHQYREIDMIKSSATDFRLCRDMFVGTVNLLIIYIILTFVAGVTTFYSHYMWFLAGALIVSNIAARSKGRKWVYNVIAYDISERRKKELNSNG